MISGLNYASLAPKHWRLCLLAATSRSQVATFSTSAVRKLHFGSSSSKVAACSGACGRLCVCVCAGALAIHLGGPISCTHVPTMHCRGALTGAVMATCSLGQKKAHTVQNRSAKRQLHVMRRYRFWGFAISFLRKKYKTRNAKSPKTYFMTREFSLLLTWAKHTMCPTPIELWFSMTLQIE